MNQVQVFMVGLKHFPILLVNTLQNARLRIALSTHPRLRIRVCDGSGSVTFYNNRWHDDSGDTYKYTIDDSQQCINLSCYNDRATSAKWSGLVEWGAFHGKSRIAFYTDKDCTGTVRHWEIKDPGYFPGNFFLDGIDDDISSFMIWQYSKTKKGTTLPCPWDFNCCLGRSPPA